MASQDLLSEYINKILSLQEKQQQIPLTENSLKQVAQEMGLSAKDWQRLQAHVSNYRTQGEGFMRYHNWDKAIKAFQQALPLSPLDKTMLEGIAESYFRRWEDEGRDSDRRQATIYAERCLEQDPSNDRALHILTKLPQPKIPDTQIETVVPTPAGNSKKAAIWIGVFALALIGTLATLFALLADGQTPQNLEVVETPIPTELGKGRRSIPLTFIGNPGKANVKLLLQQAVFQEYNKSSSFLLKGYIQEIGAELTRLKLRLELLDKEGKRIYASPIEPVEKFDDPVRSKDLIPLSFFEHIRRKGVYPHSARLSIARVEWRNIPQPYSEPVEKKVYLDGAGTGALLEFYERSSVYNEHPKDRYVFHKLELEIRNPKGEQPIKELKLRVKWTDNDGQRILEEKYAIIEEDSPQLMPGQTLPITIAQKLKRAKQASDIKNYQIFVEEVR